MDITYNRDHYVIRITAEKPWKPSQNVTNIKRFYTVACYKQTNFKSKDLIRKIGDEEKISFLLSKFTAGNYKVRMADGYIR